MTTINDTNTFDVETARDHFPALAGKQVFFDNAGGSQVLGSVIDAISTYLRDSNVQLGASYPTAESSTKKYDEGYAAAANFINASPDEIVIGPSTTQLFANLSQALSFPPSSEIILSSLDHEANISAWVRMSKAQNLVLKWWTPTTDFPNLRLTPENLRPLLSAKTVFVACTHASNVLGTIHDIRGIAEEVHRVPGALLCVDGVALAPHREVDVKALGVDFYAFSWYKVGRRDSLPPFLPPSSLPPHLPSALTPPPRASQVYGPHNATLYASTHTHPHLHSLSHYFHTSTSLPTLLSLAASSYELVAALPSILSYLGPSPTSTFHRIAIHEARLVGILLEYLLSNADITVYGERSADKELRVAVVSFGVRGRGARGVVEGVERRSAFGCRWGGFYSVRLVEGVLGLGAEGVVRVSLVHYNTEEEVRGFVRVLDEVLGEKR